jgi:hypothetical protein
MLKILKNSARNDTIVDSVTRKFLNKEPGLEVMRTLTSSESMRVICCAVASVSSGKSGPSNHELSFRPLHYKRLAKTFRQHGPVCQRGKPCIGDLDNSLRADSRYHETHCSLCSLGFPTGLPMPPRILGIRRSLARAEQANGPAHNLRAIQTVHLLHRLNPANEKTKLD